MTSHQIPPSQNPLSLPPPIPPSPPLPPVPHPLPPPPVPQALQFNPSIKQSKPPARNVIVLSFGSYAIRYGFAVDTTPRKVLPAVAFRRTVKHSSHLSPVRVPTTLPYPAPAVQNAKEYFEHVRTLVEKELELKERRRGGGKPVPWKVEIESIPTEPGPEPQPPARHLQYGPVVVGPMVDNLLRDPESAPAYDVVFPIWDGKILFSCGASAALMRRSLDELIGFIVSQLKAERQDDSLFSPGGEATIHVAVVVPETSQRRDVAEIVDALFRSPVLKTAAVFVHQSAVSCALGAGLATCTVVDIGHSTTTVACIDDGMIMGETRVHLKYGSHHIHSAFNKLLTEFSNLHHMVATEPGVHGKPLSDIQIAEDQHAIIAKIAEQTGGFNVDENDTLTVAMVKVPSGRSFRVKLGVGIRSLPCYGLVHPKLLSTANTVMNLKKDIPERDSFQRNAEDDNFVSIYNELRRGGVASQALPIGTFANDPGQPAEKTLKKNEASVVDAVIWSVGKAVELKKPEQSKAVENYRRYVNAIVLAGGGASIDGIALALEARIKKGFLEIGLNVADVTVIDGGKGKGDEELAAAAAVLKDVAANGGLVDDTDTASLPWKGGAVMVEAEAVNEYWVYRDEWEVKNVRALRERAPFYW